MPTQAACANLQKFFGSFFQKRTDFLAFSHGACRAR
jgi:hypothetical protein